MAAEFHIDDDGVLVGVSLNGATKITLPSSPKAVKAIGAFVFTSDTPIEELTLNGECERICNKAFYNCGTLKKVTIGSGLQSIEPYAFAGRYSIEEWAGGSSKYSGSGLLYDSTGKKVVLGVNKETVTFANGTTEIGNRAFSFCDKITSLELPDSLTSIGEYAFSDCSGLPAATIPSGVSTVGYGAFFGCDGIEKVILSNGVRILDGLSFAGMQNLLVVKMTDSVTDICSVIGEETFSDGGRRLRLDGNEESVSDEVKAHWKGTYGEFPSSVTIKFYTNATFAPVYVAEDVPPGAKLEVYMAAANAAIAKDYSVKGWYYDSSLRNEVGENSVVKNYKRGDDGQILNVDEIILFADYKVIVEYSDVYYTSETDNKITLTGVKDWDKLKAAEYRIPSELVYGGTSYEVTGLGDNLFAGNPVASVMTIPKTIRTIGKAAFRGCENLTEIVFTNGSKCGTIGVLAFAETGIVNFTAPDSVKRIRQGAFYGCQSLTSITLGEGVIGIGNESGNNHGTFEDCDSLVTVKIGSLGQWLGIDFGNSACNPVSNGGSLYIGNSGSPVSSISAAALGSEIKEIKPFAFVGSSCIQSVDLTGSAVTNVGEEAFSANDNLSSVTLGNGRIKTIGRAAFSNCGAITDVTVPGTVTEIGDFAFNACSNLESATIESGVTGISNSMFSYCVKLEEIDLPESVESVGMSAFSGDVSLAKAMFRRRCSFGDYAFYNCTALSEIYFSFEVDSDFGTKVFDKCPNITKVHGIPSSLDIVTLFDSSKESVEEIELLGNDSNILSGKLSGNLQQFTNLSRFVIPDRIVFIDEEYFDNVIFEGETDPPTIFNNLATEIKPSGNAGPSYYVVDKWIVARYGEIDTSVQSVDLSYSNVGVVIRGIANEVKVNAESSFTLPDTLCRGGLRSFYTSGDIDYWEETPFVGKGLTVSIAGIQTYAGGTYWANQNSTPLDFGANLVANGVDIIDEVVDVPNNIKRQTLIINVALGIGPAFYGCTSVTDLDLGEAVTNIPENAFAYCSSLKRIYFRGSNIRFNDNPFSRCDLLEQSGSAIYAQSIAAWCGCSGYGNPLGVAHNLYVYDDSTGEYNLLTAVNIPSGITYVGDHSFAGATSITSLTVPDSVTTIGESAFEGCSGLTNVTLGNGITEIVRSVFGGCTSLETINIPSGVTRIYSYAFSGVEGDTTTIPGVRLLGNWAIGYVGGLSGAINLSSIAGMADNAFEESGITSVTIGGIKTIPEWAFSRNTALESVTLTEGTVTIGEYAFGECTHLTSITIPNSVKTLGEQSFLGCEALSSITIGSGVEEIGAECFSGIGAEELYIPNSVHTIEKNAFNLMTKLIRIDFGMGVQNLGYAILQGCDNLEKVVFHGPKPQNVDDYVFFEAANLCKFYFEPGAEGWVDGEVWCGRTFNVYTGQQAE